MQQAYSTNNNQTVKASATKDLFLTSLFTKGLRGFFFIIAFLLFGLRTFATVETLPAGSYIINMGVAPQTINNGLKPYGLIYELLKTYNIPVKWVINQTKPASGTDFTYNGTSYKGGTFIVPGSFITSTIQTRINYWISQGVVATAASTAFSVDVTYTFKSAPRWVLDATNGSIAANYLTNAGIPSSAYVYKDPSQLSTCDDIFVMPHAALSWSSHKNLYYWNLNSKGSLWSGCYTVSALENSNGPDINNAATIRRMNFLMSDGPTASQNAVPFTNHGDGTPPFTTSYPSHPIMQFMGRTDSAHKYGNEKIYMPYKPGGGWRLTTFIGEYDPTQSDIPSTSAGPAATIAFGRGFGDNNRGWVTYEGGHDLAWASTPQLIAAQRVFLNFSFLASFDKAPVVTITTSIPANINSGSTSNLSAAATASFGTSTFTYQWSSSIGGTFSNPNSASTTFTAPVFASNTSGFITCKVTDNCGRVSFETQAFTVTQGLRPPIAVNDVGIMYTTCLTGNVTVNVLANDYDQDGDPITLTSVGTGTNGTFVNSGNGNITYTPNVNFIGTDQAQYQVCDSTGRCSTATLTVTVTSPIDAYGCNAGQYYGIASTIDALRATISAGAPTSKDNSISSPDGIPGDATTYTTFGTNGQSIIYSLEAAIPATGTLYIYADASANGKTLQVEESTDSTTWTNLTSFTVNSTDDFLDATAKNYTVHTGTKFIRLTNSSSSIYIDAPEYNVMSCLSALPIANDDAATTLEDMPVIIDVLSNDDDPQNRAISVTAIISGPSYGKVSINPDGTITYLNNKDVRGVTSDQFTYRIVNSAGLYATATVTVNINADGCPTGQYKPYSFTATVVNVNPIADTYIANAATTTNYGTSTSLYVKGKNQDKKRSLLQFDLSSIPSNAIIDSASFSMYKTGGVNGESVALYRLTKAWTETGATWNKADGTNSWTFAGGDANSTIVATVNMGSTTGYKNWNVKSMVQGWVSGTYPNYGLTALRNPEGSGVKDMIFASRESTNKPTLYVSYRVPGSCTPIPLYAALALPDTATTNSITPVTINVAANDFDYNGTGLTVSAIGTTSKRGGTITLSSNKIVYTPPATAYNGIDTFSYRVCSSSLCDTTYGYVTVTNAAPIAKWDAYTLASNTATTPNSVTASVMTNDTDPEGSTLGNLTITAVPKNGVATVSGTQITYTPSTNFIGNDTLIYSITETGTQCAPLSDTALVVFTVTNRAPIASNETVSTNPCETKVIDVIANDVDPEGGVLSVTIVSGPAIGTVTLVNNNSQVQYTPPAGTTNTSTTFTYKVCDDANPSLCSATATATVTIKPTPVNTAPVALRDTFSILRNEILYADVLSNDSDPDGNDFVTPVIVVTNPTHGTITTYSNGLVGYTPSNNYVGLDSFKYQVCDKIVALAGCTPAPSLCTTSWAYIVVQGAPIATSIKINVTKNTTKNLNVLANDIFGYYGPATGALSIVMNSTNGTSSVVTGSSGNQSDNLIRYTPNASFVGLDSLVYMITDNKGNIDTAIAYMWVLPDTDGDGVADDVDIDDDNDGIPDYVEVCGAGAAGWSCTPNNSDPSLDDDNDGIINYKDADWSTLNSAGCAAFLDSDGDGIPDYLDRDSDNDGIPDVVEALGVDANGDGIIDNFCDTDGDGLSQNVDANNTGAASSGQGLGAPDFDGDGIANCKDLDSDNDGIPDIIESYGTDTNNDGRVDSFTDTDGDGWSNAYDGDANGDGVVENLSGVLILTGVDPNYVSCSNPGNGHPSCYSYNGNADNQGLPNFLDLDSDGDGITDAIESGITTTSYVRGMVSGCTLVNGWCSSIKAMASLNLTNTDNVGRPNAYDIDSDNDGITDNIEGQPTSSYVVPTDADSDNDGIADVYDVYNGIGGNGITPYDYDNDGIPDYMDVDSDNDGVPDRNEGDTRNQTLTQTTINTSGDTDGDGMMDYFDTYNLTTQNCSTVYRNVSMSNMGPGGNYYGPTPPGSNVQLVMSVVTAPDRDWRNNAILPLGIISFTGSLNNNIVSLTWKVENEKDVNYYVVERSADGSKFDVVTNVKANNQSESYKYNDKISGNTAPAVYYRIKQVSKSGEIVYTKVISFSLSKVANTNLEIYPVPVIDVLTLSITSASKQTAHISICDALGKVLIQKTAALEKGNNKVEMAEVAKLSKGLFVIKVRMTEATITGKGIKE
jgi:hypothetical protein